MRETEEPEAAPPPEGKGERKSLLKRFNSPEWSARADVLAGILGLAAVIIVVLKS